MSLRFVSAICAIPAALLFVPCIQGAPTGMRDPAPAHSAEPAGPRDRALPESLIGFVGMRIDRLNSMVAQSSRAGDAPDINSIMGLERVCGLTATSVTTLCIASRASDGAGVMLVGSKDSIKVEKVAEVLCLTAGKPQPAGRWKQWVLQDKEQTAMLAVEVNPTEMLLLQTTRPQKESVDDMAQLIRDLKATRDVISADPALIWGKIGKRPADKAFAGGWLRRLDTVLAACSPVVFEFHGNASDKGVRLLASGELRHSIQSLGGVAFGNGNELLEAAAADGLKNPPVWHCRQSGGRLELEVKATHEFLRTALLAREAHREAARLKRKAQEFCMAYAAVKEEGETQIGRLRDVSRILSLLSKGVRIPGKAPNAEIIKVEASEEEIRGAAAFLMMSEDGQLFYTGTGTDLTQPGDTRQELLLAAGLLMELIFPTPAAGSPSGS